MEEFYSEKGVFIHSETLETKCMIECLQSLLMICPDINITSVISDATINGYRLCFEDSEVRTVLDKRCITVADRQISMYPLTTCIIIRDVHAGGVDNFDRDLSDAIQEKFGKVLNLEKMPCPADNQIEKSIKSYLVHIDIPEIKNLSVFKKNGYPRMFISIPSMCKTFQVAFWCRRCRNHGHIHQECSENPEKMKNNLEKETSSARKSNQRKIKMRPRVKNNPERFLKLIDSFASKVGIDEIAKRVSEEKNSLNQENEKDEDDSVVSRVADTLSASNLRKENVSKTEFSEENNLIVKNAETSKANELSQRTPEKYAFSGNDIISPREIKKEVDDSSFHESPGSTKKWIHSDEETRPFPPDATSTTDDDIQIIGTATSTSNRFRQSTNSRDATSESDGMKTEPAFPAGNAAHNFPAPPNFPSPFNRNSQFAGLFTTTAQKQHIEATGVLSERLQNCINDSCNVLDRKTLDAFLTHVKKKSNPIRVAANYTANVQGLKEQLKQILYLYYNTPQTGTKEDIAFIKWLNGLVDRFDGTAPRKRKPSSKVGGGTPNKKMS